MTGWDCVKAPGHDDENGYVDGLIGWNWVGNGNKAQDDKGHGNFAAVCLICA